MHEERAGGGGKYFTALMVGMVPVWGLSWLLFGGPPTGVFGWVLGAVAFALGYVVFNAFGQFYTSGRRICPYCRKRIPERAVACHRCGRNVGG